MDKLFNVVCSVNHTKQNTPNGANAVFMNFQAERTYNNHCFFKGSCRAHCYSIFEHITTYLVTPWSRVLLEKPTGSAATQEITHIFGTPRFITVLTRARHLSLSWGNSIESSHPPPTSRRSILILSSHLRLGLSNGLFPSGFPTRTLCTPLPSPHAPPKSPNVLVTNNTNIRTCACIGVKWGGGAGWGANELCTEHGESHFRTVFENSVLKTKSDYNIF